MVDAGNVVISTDECRRTVDMHAEGATRAEVMQAYSNALDVTIIGSSLDLPSLSLTIRGTPSDVLAAITGRESSIQQFQQVPGCDQPRLVKVWLLEKGSIEAGDQTAQPVILPRSASAAVAPERITPTFNKDRQNVSNAKRIEHDLARGKNPDRAVKGSKQK